MANKKQRVFSTSDVVYGPEPEFDAETITDQNYNSIISPMLLWYGQYAGTEKDVKRTATHKAWLKEWALQNGFKKKHFTFPSQGISTAAAVAKLALKGFPLQERHRTFLSEFIVKCKPEKDAFDRVEHGKKLAQQKKLHDEKRISELYTVFDCAIDSVLAGRESQGISVEAITPKHERELTEYYTRALKEIKTSDDYQGRKRLQTRLIGIHEEILSEIQTKAQTTRAVKKATRKRVKRKKPASSQVAKLQYKQMDADCGMVSVDPEKLVGCSTAFIFDTRKRFLKRFVAADIDGIQVRGTTLKNCTATQKTIRKPAEQLLGLDKMPITKATKLFDAARAVEKETTGRTNRDCVIVRVF